MNHTVAIKDVLGTLVPLLNIMSALMSVFMPDESTPPPFRVIWNYPDKSCRSRGIDFNLASYGIESNRNHFIEDTIALYYSSKIGMWPYIEFGNETVEDTHVHGGYPHTMELAEHLKHISDIIANHQSPFSSGFGVFDMELWRPILKTNYGRFTPYREKIVEVIADRHPDLKIHEHRSKARALWNMSTKMLMLLSLTVAKITRPYAKWGYYGYPELSTSSNNHDLDWLWGTVTAYYPSIYIKNFSLPVSVAENAVKASIAESFRVRAQFGTNPDHPIMAYTSVQTIPQDTAEKWLEAALKIPIEMGVDGLILWASSRHFQGDAWDNCSQMQLYTQETIGPYIKNLLKRMSQCSQQLCTNRGRCVRKSYAKAFPFLANRGIPRPILNEKPIVEPLLFRKVAVGYKREFVCQCYTGWHGRRCAQTSVEEMTD